MKVKEIKVIDNTTNHIDMPKLESPFVREENKDGEYIVTPEIKEKYSWVFSSDKVKAVEKLDGTNVSVVIRDGQITGVFNRDNRVPAFNKHKHYITKGILNSMHKDWLDIPDGQWYGELVGPKVNGNPYDLEQHLWIPFRWYSQKHLFYKSWGKYPKTFESIRDWFRDDLIPLFYAKRHNINFEKAEKKGFVEGVVFTHRDGRMAKLRRDMFEFYEGGRHKK